MNSGKSSSVQCNEKPTSPTPITQKRATHRYRGHRSNSFTVPSNDPLLVEVRARQRTFNGAYGRTALGNLGYALTILRLYDTRFYKIGLVFAILGALLFTISFFRDRHSRHDFADQEDSNSSSSSCKRCLQTKTAHSPFKKATSYVVSWFSPSAALCLRHCKAIQTVGASRNHIFGRPFVTAGWIVIVVTIAVFLTEATLIWLIVTL